MTKNEKRLQKKLQKLTNATEKYLEVLTEVDESMRELPIGLSLTYNLEKNYFNKVPNVITPLIHLTAGTEAIVEMILDEDKEIKTCN